MGVGFGTAYAQEQGQDQGMWRSRWGAHDPATAADTGLYVGAGYVRAQVNNVFGTSGYDFKIDDNAWKAIVGLRPIPPFAVEANYVDLGHQSRRLLGGNPPNGHADARAFDLFGVGLLPLGAVDLYAKAGGALAAQRQSAGAQQHTVRAEPQWHELRVGSRHSGALGATRRTARVRALPNARN